MTAIKFKKDNISEESLLAVMFNPETEAQQLYEYAQDLYRAYSNSIFFYFYETKINEVEGGEGEEDGDGEGEGEGEAGADGEDQD